jgi:hypothetical protein
MNRLLCELVPGPRLASSHVDYIGNVSTQYIHKLAPTYLLSTRPTRQQVGLCIRIIGWLVGGSTNQARLLLRIFSTGLVNIDEQMEWHRMFIIIAPGSTT